MPGSGWASEMPVVTIQIVAGRAAQKKREMIRAVATAVAATLDAPIDTVRIIVHEIPPDLWGAGTETIAERQSRSAHPGATS